MLGLESGNKLTMISLCFIVLFVYQSLALYSNNTEVIKLNENNFKDLVVESESIWIVSFYTPQNEECKKISPVIVDVAKSLKNIIQVAAINVDDNKSIESEYKIIKCPSILIFGKNKTKPHVYSGEIKAENLKRTVTDVLKNKYKRYEKITVLSEDNFDDNVRKSSKSWIVCFYSPMNDEYNNEFLLTLNDLANKFEDKVNVGIVDTTINKELTELFQSYEQSKILIKYLDADKKSDLVDYVGELTTDELESWAHSHYVKNLLPPEVIQIINAETAINACKDMKICILSVLPPLNICNNDCRLNSLNTLKGVANEFKENPWCWLWTVLGEQPQIEKVLNITASAVAAVNLRKYTYSTLLTDFDGLSITQYLINLKPDIPVKVNVMPEIYDVLTWNYNEIKDEL